MRPGGWVPGNGEGRATVWLRRAGRPRSKAAEETKRGGGSGRRKRGERDKGRPRLERGAGGPRAPEPECGAAPPLSGRRAQESNGLSRARAAGRRPRKARGTGAWRRVTGVTHCAPGAPSGAREPLDERDSGLRAARLLSQVSPKLEPRGGGGVRCSAPKFLQDPPPCSLSRASTLGRALRAPRQGPAAGERARVGADLQILPGCLGLCPRPCCCSAVPPPPPLGHTPSESSG